MTPGPAPGNRTDWGNALRTSDYAVLAYTFGFADGYDMKRFADSQQDKADRRATRRSA